MRTDNNPIGRLIELFQNQMFMANGYHHSTIGYMSDLNNISRADCAKYFQENYVGSNMVVTVVGDVDMAEALLMYQSVDQPKDLIWLPSPINVRELDRNYPRAPRRPHDPCRVAHSPSIKMQRRSSFRRPRCRQQKPSRWQKPLLRRLTKMPPPWSRNRRTCKGRPVPCLWPTMHKTLPPK